MNMKHVLLSLSICICAGCQQRTSVGDSFYAVDDIPQQQIFFTKAGPNSLVKGSGSFVVVHDTVFFVDYYYDYNDGKELSLFSLRGGKKERLVDNCYTLIINIGSL